MAAEQEMIMTDGDTTGQQPHDLQMLAGLPPAGAWLQAHGLMLSEISGVRVTAYIDLGAHHLTPWGVVHGGVYTTAIETVASVGASLAVHERAEFAVGVDQSADFLRSMRDGRVDIVAEPVIQGRVQQLWRVTITRHEDGKAIAVGRVRLQNVPIAPTG
jgi:1,4-dihydroxy-2-naphthoyl-CoA hydrolase